MTRGAMIVAGLLGGVLLLTTWVSYAGWGVPQPENEPPSIREGSTRISKAGHYRTRYFVGGGIFAGK